jgi:hypothetical protein
MTLHSFLKTKNGQLAIVVIVILLVVVAALIATQQASAPVVPAPIGTTTPPASTTPRIPVPPKPVSTVPEPPLPEPPLTTKATVNGRTYLPDGWGVVVNIPSTWVFTPTTDSAGNVTRLSLKSSEGTMTIAKDIAINPPTTGHSVTTTREVLGTTVTVTTFNLNDSYFKLHKGAADYYFHITGGLTTFIGVLEGVDVH